MASGAQGSEVTIAAVASEVAAAADMGVMVASPEHEHADLPAMDPINDVQSDGSDSDVDLAADDAMVAHQAPGLPAAPGLPVVPPVVLQYQQQHRRLLDIFLQLHHLRASLPQIRNPVFPDYARRRTFIKLFQGHFIDYMDCPPRFSSSYLGDVLPSVRILDFQVAVDIVDGCIRFSQGWPAFVEAERIVAGESAQFLLVAPNTFAVRLFSPNGCQRPLVSNPRVIWNLNAPAAP
ncbi:unnamed protein product [Urochloa decumbens]|uniref:TF-B3 domain-containing protein n=1 Tax=Urochloa decumbens TaxID=240449 RepID=A0ABC8YWR8_9POAL